MNLALHHADNVDLFNLLKIIWIGAYQGKKARRGRCSTVRTRDRQTVIMGVAGATNSKNRL